MSTVRVRRLDADYDPVFGQGKNDYIEDLDAVVQIIKSRLLLLMGEWWENLDEGLPLWQSILGKRSSKIVVDNLIQQRILKTPYVTSIEFISSTYDSSARSYIFSAVVNTQFGTVGISNQQ